MPPDFDLQKKRLLDIITSSTSISPVQSRAGNIPLPNWYLGPGCIPTVVWNTLCDRPIEEHMDDIDLVYFDGEDLTEAGEQRGQQQINALFDDLTIDIDVINEARVNLWYEDKFGHAIPPYDSVEDGIASWVSTSAIGIRRNRGAYEVHASCGLDDLFTMTIRPNKRVVSEAYYIKKTAQWKQTWPAVQVVP
jgi:hypothetical protein